MSNSQRIREYHPYSPYIPVNVEKLIIGSFPIGKFTNPDRACEIDVNTEFNFYYGGNKNTLWKILGDCFNQRLKSVDDIKSFLTSNRIGVIDVISSCVRINGSAADSALKDIEFNQSMSDVLAIPTIKRLLFTSKQVQKWFNEQDEWQKLAKHKDSFILPSPSPQAAIAISSTNNFKNWKLKNPTGNTITYRVEIYKKIFASNC